jgi:hypothetical protein
MRIRPHITEDDTIRIVRIVVKCSDLLSDFDTLEEYMKNKTSKFIRQEVKAPFVKLGDYVDKFSSAFLTSFVQADDIIQMELETTALGMLYSKSKSICDDISEMKYTDKRLEMLYKCCNDFVKIVEKKYPLTLLKTDPNGHCIYDVAVALTKLGKTIMYSKKPGDV